MGEYQTLVSKQLKLKNKILTRKWKDTDTKTEGYNLLVLLEEMEENLLNIVQLNSQTLYAIKDGVSGLYVNEYDFKYKLYNIDTDTFITGYKQGIEDLFKRLKDYEMDFDCPEDYYEPELKIVKLTITEEVESE